MFSKNNLCDPQITIACFIYQQPTCHERARAHIRSPTAFAARKPRQVVLQRLWRLTCTPCLPATTVLRPVIHILIIICSRLYSIVNDGATNLRCVGGRDHGRRAHVHHWSFVLLIARMWVHGQCAAYEWAVWPLIRRVATAHSVDLIGYV